MFDKMSEISSVRYFCLIYSHPHKCEYVTSVTETIDV